MQLVRLILILLPFLLQTIAGNGQSLQQDQKLVKGVLKNGLTYYIYPNTFPKGQVVYRLFLKTGSLSENDQQLGLAHFLEHMAFNGSSHFPKDSLIRFLQAQGARFGKDFNAHTSYNETVFKLTLGAEPLLIDKALLILSDWASGLALDSADIEKERGVVLSEWLTKQKGGTSAEDVFLQVLLNKSRFSDRLVIGDTSVLKHFDASTLRNYYNDWYDPSLMAVAITGDVDPVSIEKLVRQKFEQLPAKKKILPQALIKPHSTSDLKMVFHPSEKKLEFHMLRLFPKGPEIKTEKAYLADLEFGMLNQLLRNRLKALSFDSLPYKNGSLSSFEFLRSTNVLSGSAQLPITNPVIAIQEYLHAIRQIRVFGFTNPEIRRVKEALERQLIARKNAGNRSSEILINSLYADFYQGHTMLSPETRWQLFERFVKEIDSAGLQQRMQTILQPAEMQYIISGFAGADSLLPNKKKIITGIQNGWQKPVTPYVSAILNQQSLLEDIPPEGEILSRESLPELNATSLHLSNGVRVILRPSVQSEGRVMISGFRKGGHYAVQEFDYINSQFAGNIVALSGAGKHTREGLTALLEKQSANVRFLIDKTRSGIAGSSTEEDVENLMQLIYLKWTAPNADSTVFALVKRKTTEDLKNRSQTDADEFQKTISGILNGDDYTTKPWTVPLLDSQLVYQRILPVFKQSFGSAEGYTFLIFSDLPATTLEDLVVKYLGSLPTGKPDTVYQYRNTYVSPLQKRIELKEGISPKATVTLFYQDTVITDTYNKFQLKGDMMASLVRMKLLKRLREELGMVYSVQVSFGSNPVPQPLVRQTISFVTDPANVSFLIGEVNSILEVIANNPSDMEKELLDVKKNTVREMDVATQKETYWSGFIRNSLFYEDEDWSFVTNYAEEINAVQAVTLSAMVRRYFINAHHLEAIRLPEENNNQ